MIGQFSGPYFAVGFFWKPKCLLKKMCLKEKFAIVAEKQRSAADIPNFRVGFWEFL